VRHSDYFRRALAGCWKEAEESAVSLDDVEAEAFEMSTKACVFGDRFVAPSFERAASNYLALAIQQHIYIEAIDQQDLIYAFENIPADRVIVQCLVDEFCVSWNDDVDIYSAIAMGRLPPEVLCRVAKRFQEMTTMSSIENLRIRCYLEHESEKKKEMCESLHIRWDQDKELAFFD
jgi:hypothetical protein